MLRSNGSKRRSVKASNRVSRLITRPGLATNILSTANSPRVRGIGSPNSAGQQASVEIEDEPGEAHDRCGFPRRLNAVKSRSVAHERSSVRAEQLLHSAARPLQAIYQPNIFCLRHFSVWRWVLGHGRR